MSDTAEKLSDRNLSFSEVYEMGYQHACQKMQLWLQQNSCLVQEFRTDNSEFDTGKLSAFQALDGHLVSVIIPEGKKSKD
ncbi:MAG: hypothetical protein HRT83_03915 [Hyphomicrobiaceae bacterium]|nr:hypothetical protein [Hyphomicrobiaceae bacterium]